MSLQIKSKENCRWDIVSLGEIMIRFDPGPRRIWTTRSFDVCEGGGEYDVSRGLKRCFGLDAAHVTAFADNPVGRLLQDLIYQGGVDQTYTKWVEYDGIGRKVRNGLNFVERGFGVRAPLGCSDRGHTAASQLKKGDFLIADQFNQQVIKVDGTGAVVSTYGTIGVSGSDDGLFNAPCDAKVVGDFTGLTSPKPKPKPKSGGGGGGFQWQWWW